MKIRITLSIVMFSLASISAFIQADNSSYRFRGCYKMPYKDEKCFLFKDRFDDPNVSIDNYFWVSKSLSVRTFKTSYNSNVVVDYVCPIIFDISAFCESPTTLLFGNETRRIESLYPLRIEAKSLIIIGIRKAVLFSHVGNDFYYKIDRSDSGVLQVGVCSEAQSSSIEYGVIRVIPGAKSVGSLVNYRRAVELNLAGKFVHFGEEECPTNPNARIENTYVSCPRLKIEGSHITIGIKNDLSAPTMGKFWVCINESFLPEKTKCLDGARFDYKIPEITTLFYRRLPMKIVMIAQSTGDQTKVERSLYAISY